MDITGCAAGYQFVDGYCFRLFLEEKSWNDAETICTDHAGHLVTIENIEKNQAIKAYLELWMDDPGEIYDSHSNTDDTDIEEDPTFMLAISID